MAETRLMSEAQGRTMPGAPGVRVYIARWLPACVILWLGHLLRVANLASLPLVPDEAYYWLWSRHLDWAYYDHPSGIAVLLRLSTMLGGQGEYGIRWLNALLGTACIALAWALGARLFSYRSGRVAAWLVATSAPCLIVSRFAYTDTLLVFLMLVNLWWFWSLAQSVRGALHRDRGIDAHPPVSRMRHGTMPAWLPYAAWGLSLGLLLNTKYTALLYIGGLGLWLVLERHPLLRERHFWLATGFGALGALPVIGWNAAHDWASFRWQLAHLSTPSPGMANDGGAWGMAWIWAANARHFVLYLTWPVVVTGLTAILPVLRRHTPAAARVRLVGCLALSLVAPVLLSPAGSPRNLIGGVTFLCLGAGAALVRLNRRLRPIAAALAACVAAYGLGTVLALIGLAPGMHSSVVPEIRRAVIGMRDLPQVLRLSPGETVFSIDYSLAGQLAYYTGAPVTTGWGQYQIWEQPDLFRLTMVSLPYVPPIRIDRELRNAYTAVGGPYAWKASEEEGIQVTWWRAEGLRWLPKQIPQTFDLFALTEATP